MILSAAGAVDNVDTGRAVAAVAGCGWAGFVVGPVVDRRNRLNDDAACRPIFDPSSRRHRRSGYGDGEGAEALGVERTQKLETSAGQLSLLRWPRHRVDRRVGRWPDTYQLSKDLLSVAVGMGDMRL